MVKMLIGLPGCGKSTYANSETNKGFIVLSSDAIREELSGDASNQINPKVVFGILHKRFESYLKEGKNIILDATHIKLRDRQEALMIAARYRVPVIAVVFDIPVEICKERNLHRERVVPEYVYDRMLGQYDEPILEEGFAEIITIQE